MYSVEQVAGKSFDGLLVFKETHTFFMNNLRKPSAVPCRRFFRFGAQVVYIGANRGSIR